MIDLNKEQQENLAHLAWELLMDVEMRTGSTPKPMEKMLIERAFNMLREFKVTTAKAKWVK